MKKLIFFKTSKIANPLVFILIMTKHVPTLQPYFLHQDILHLYDHFLHKILRQTLHVTDPEYENFPHQSSSDDQILSVLGTLEDTIFNSKLVSAK